MQTPPVDSFPHWLLWLVGMLVLAAAGGWIKYFLERKKTGAETIAIHANAGKTDAEKRRIEFEIVRDTTKELIDAGHEIDQLFDERRELRDNIAELHGHLRKRVEEIEIELKRIRAVAGLKKYMEEKEADGTLPAGDDGTKPTGRSD